MSLLSPEPRIALTPTRVALRSGRAYLERACAEPGWPGALATLARLAGEHRLRGRCHVILSQHFATCHLVAPPAVALGPGETRAWIAERLAGRIDERARDWRLAWQPAPGDENLLVAAMDPSRFEELATAFAGQSMTLATVRPWLSDCCDGHWRRLGRGRHWLVLLEPGRYSVAALDDGRFLAVSTRRAGAEPGAEIEAELSRQALLADLPAGLPRWLGVAGLAPEALGANLGQTLGRDDGSLSAMLAT